ncbi:amidohydrolase family protein [Labedaea rhizosphaerae]|uniref:Imidazolonepropionase-like amidohydrolase n=1 Tax=Labedaea rhizosphaerae TaxID=598644 RepID=A0A4V3CYD1_LABRH|nr:amidohydrolase family protein [Labedaea rhizosphaerae]TDP93668.1 imidazolonepropionase-like amidohydrolase [Labedaea rhizosphaerae]
MSTLLTGALVFDPDSGETTRADVLMAGDRIEAVGSDLSGDERVDCSGGVLIPGLIDCHVHVAFPRPDPLPRSARVLEAVPVLRRLLERGITTVRDAWGADAGFQHALREGWITGPDLLVSLRQLGPSGGLGDWWQPDLGRVDRIDDPSLPDAVFDGPAQARAAVRRMVRAGADWIKLGASGAFRQVGENRSVAPTDEELHAVVDEARRCGRDVMAHAHTASTASAAARAGVRSIEHGVFLDEVSIADMRARECWYVPTLAALDGVAEAFAAHRKSLAMALAAGVPIAAGSDLAPRPHVDLRTELRLLAEAGLGDVGALRAATSEAARLLRLDRGRIAPGLRADIVLVDRLDVADLGVRAVWQAGSAVA